MKPFDDKSREMDREIRGLWILLLASFILYSLPWAIYSGDIIDRFAVECVSNRPYRGIGGDCIVPAGAIALFVAVQAAIIVLIFKIGRQARKFMEHYNKAAKSKPARLGAGRGKGGRKQ
jgi:hypothetical protein